MLRLRVLTPKLGTRKLMHKMQDFFAKHEFKMGRDEFFDLLREHQLLIRRRQSRKPQTTFSSHWFKKYPNLIVDLVIDRPNQVWVSDITYIVVGDGFGYLFLLTDAYSRKIIGYCIDASLSAQGALKALKMALRQKPATAQTIHHSDRGVQYCCWDYIHQLTESSVGISMTQNSDPRENAIAERVNGILKQELLEKGYATMAEAQAHLPKVISIYNVERPHSSLDFMTPSVAHTQEGVIKRRWKTYPYKPAKPDKVPNGPSVSVP